MSSDKSTVRFISGLTMVPKQLNQGLLSTRAFSQTASQQQAIQSTPGSFEPTQGRQSSRSSKVVPVSEETLQSRGATKVINNPVAEGGRKKKPVSKPKNKKMTSPKKKQTRK